MTKKPNIACLTGKILPMDDDKSSYTFILRPRIEQWNDTLVHFNDAQRPHIVKNKGKVVDVRGFEMLRLETNVNPSEIRLDEITLIREPADEKNAPTFEELRGCAPNITGGKSVQEYLDDIRNEWD